MKRVDAERGALLCAAHFVADYENLLPSVSGKYAADYDTTIDGEEVTLSCTCIRSDKQSGRIETFLFRIEQAGGGEISMEGEYSAACRSALRFINAYLRLLKNQMCRL